MTRGQFFFLTLIACAFVGYSAGKIGAEYYLYANATAFANADAPIIDFTVPSVQALSDRRFAVAELSQEEHLAGIKFSGRIINMTAVDFEGVTFELRAAGEGKNFTISRISSGDSTGFEVYVPDLSAAGARIGQILFRSGMVSYLAT